MFRNLIHLPDTRLNAQVPNTRLIKKKGQQVYVIQETRRLLSVNQKNGRLVSLSQDEVGCRRSSKRKALWMMKLVARGHWRSTVFETRLETLRIYALGVGVEFPAPLDSCAKKRGPKSRFLSQRCPPDSELS